MKVITKVFYDLDRPTPSGGQLRTKPDREQENIDRQVNLLFRPLEPSQFDLSSTPAPEVARNMNLDPEVFRVLLQKMPEASALMQKISSGDANWKDLDAIRNMQYDGFQLSVVLFKLAMKSGKSAVAILNEIFDTNITPDTTITVDETRMTIRDAIGHAYLRSFVQKNTVTELGKLKK